MKLFGYTITRTPLYSLADINTFRAGLREDEYELSRLKTDIRKESVYSNRNRITDLENTTHVAREVLLRHLEAVL